MIRVNLAKGIGGKKSGAPLFGMGSGGAEAATTDEGFTTDNPTRALLIRFAVIFMGVVLLIVYEQSNVPPLRSKSIALKRQLEEVRAKNQANVDVVNEISRYEKEQEKLQTQINAIEAIKRDRLREVRVLDYIQREIPEKVWLQKMDLLEGKLQITGYATADNELTTFMEGLQRSAYLKEVLLVRSAEVSLQDLGTVKRFEISCSMEKATK